MKHGRAIGRLDNVGHVAGGRYVSDGDRHAVVDDVQDFADQDASVERHRLARFDVEFKAGLNLDPLEEGDQIIDLIVGAGDMMAAAEVQPFKAADMRRDARFYRCPGAF